MIFVPVPVFFLFFLISLVWLLDCESVGLWSPPAANQIKEQSLHHRHAVCHSKRSTVRQLSHWLDEADRWPENHALPVSLAAASQGRENNGS